MDQKQCVIVNFGMGGGYPRGTARLLESLQPYGFPTLTWVNQYPPGSPTHKEHPYAFKCYAFQAARQAGYRYVHWCDSSLYAVKSPQAVFEAIARDGYYFRENGWNCGQWMTDESLAIMHLDRDTAAKMPDFTGCCMGLDFEHPQAQAWFAEWFRHATSGAFRGDWRNDRQQCSRDPRCLGHRHDQVIGSVIFNRMGLKFNQDDLFQYAPNGWPNCPEPLRPNIVFINRGCP